MNKDNWVFERSSGFAGYRCKYCHRWIYQELYDLEIRECDCDNHITEKEIHLKDNKDN